MKIFIISRAWWPIVKGGSEKFIYRVYERLLRKGYDVHVITRSDVKNDDRIHVIRSRISMPIISSYMFSRKAASYTNSMRPDVTIINSYWGESSSLYIKRDIPVISIIHDVGLFRSPIARKDLIRYYLRKHVLRKVVERADKIVVPTEIVKKDLERFLSADPDKIYVLGSEGADAPLRYEHIDNEFFDIVQIARFSPNKAQHLSLKMIRRLAEERKNVRLWLVGGSGVSRSEIEYMMQIVREAEEINKMFNRKIVEIIIDAEDVSQYYKIADLCIAPSIAEEGYGLSIVECMGYGKPVIASEIFHETGVVDEDRAYIFKTNDLDKFIDLVKYVIDHKEEALSKASKSLEYVRERCSWDNVVDKLEKIMLDLVKR